MIYKEFILALQEAAGSFRWRLGYFHEIRATRGHRVDFSPLSAVAWHQTRLPLGSLTHPEVVRLRDGAPDLSGVGASQPVSPRNRIGPARLRPAQGQRRLGSAVR